MFLCEQDEEEGMEAEFEGVIHGVIDSERAGAEKAKEKLEPRSVDAYWLQRELNKFFKDPIVSLVDINALYIIPLYQWAVVTDGNSTFSVGYLAQTCMYVCM